MCNDDHRKAGYAAYDLYKSLDLVLYTYIVSREPLANTTILAFPLLSLTFY